ncbi:MAG: peptide ABC transporter substrate-binding protein [Planctomycetes bacterium]|nr:peptide ABC transporter substrate-binding protein [Planctomycetota bacterium]
MTNTAFRALVALLALAGARLSASELPAPEDLAKVRWIPRPCIDFYEAHRAALAQGGPPPAESEVIGLPNDGPEANRKILATFGRLPASDAEVDWDAVVNRWLIGEPSTLNPLFASSRYEFWLSELLFAQPVSTDRRFEHYGDLNVVETWETSADRLMDRIVFRDDLTWSDGTPFTAHDVEFTFKVLTDKRVQIPAIRSLAEGLRAVKAYDKKTVVYFQKEALATNHLHMAWPFIPSHVYETSWAEDSTLQKSEHHVKLNNAPVTLGPYKLVSWRKAQEIVLARDEEWFLGKDGRAIRRKPFFREVRFKVFAGTAPLVLAFLGGDVDEAQLDSVQWTKDTAAKGFYATHTKVRGDEWAFAFIGWNARSVPPNPFFGDKRVRLAMTYALDHDFLRNELFFGLYQPAAGVFHPDAWMAAKGLEPFRQDLDKAEELLDEAGWKDSDSDGGRDKLVDGKLVPFDFTLICPSVGTGPKVAEQLKSDLEKIGVKCHVQLIEWVKFQTDVHEHKAQAFIQAWGTGTDPDTMRNIWMTREYETGRNHVGYSNPRVDALFEQARREHDLAKRAALYGEIDRRIYEDHPLTMLVYTPTLWGFSTSLRGYAHSPRGFTRVLPGFHAWWKMSRETKTAAPAR